MHFLAKLYSDRLNENFTRNSMSKKIAPSRPQPNTRGIHHHCETSLPREKGGEQQILNRFLESQVKSNIVADVQSPPPTYIDAVEVKPMIRLVPAFEETTISEEKKPIGAAFVKPRLNRTGSLESGMYTGSEAGSNVSISA